MTIKQRYKLFIEYFSKHRPDAETELIYKSPFQLLVAVILSAQCTDKRVNIITKELFSNYPDVYSFAKTEVENVFKLISSCSYPNNKAKYIVELSKTLVEKYGGQVPKNVEELMQLPGVGRKSANVVASVAFKIPAMPVDTHVFRVAARIGLTQNAKTPLQTEEQLVKHIPKDKLNLSHHWLILHGRYICQARKPKCKDCGINNFCAYFTKN
ncbi:MAG: endonuclease III [Bacteroidales bacterium]|nr:endonuclease III [Bacteroidales bacterium]